MFFADGRPILARRVSPLETKGAIIAQSRILLLYPRGAALVFVTGEEDAACAQPVPYTLDCTIDLPTVREKGRLSIVRILESTVHYSTVLRF